jgi:hypothetical protein
MFALSKPCALWTAIHGSPGDFMGRDFKTHLPISRPSQVYALLHFENGEVTDGQATRWMKAVAR